MTLDDGKTISLSERLSGFLAGHGDCGGSLETVREGRLVTVTCESCGRSFSYASSVAERSSEEPARAFERLTSTVPPPKRSKPRTRRRVAPPGPFAPRAHPREDRGGDARGRGRRLPPPGPLAPRRVRRGPGHQLRRLGRAARRLQHEVGGRRRAIALTALSIAGAYLVVSLTGGAETSSSRPEEAVQGRPTAELVGETPEAGSEIIAQAQPPSTPAGPPASVTRDRVVMLDGRLSALVPTGWRRAEPLSGSALLRAADGSARVVILPAPLAKAGGYDAIRLLSLPGAPRRHIAILRVSPDASNTQRQAGKAVLNSLRPAR